MGDIAIAILLAFLTAAVFLLGYYAFTLRRQLDDMDYEQEKERKRAGRFSLDRLVHENYQTKLIENYRSFVVTRGYLKDFCDFVENNEITIEAGATEMGPPWEDVLEEMPPIKLPDRSATFKEIPARIGDGQGLSQ